MSMLLRVCAAAGCRRTVPKRSTFCAEHAAADERRRATKRKRFGYGRSHWQQLRLQRLALAGGVCELRLPGCTRRATHVHLDPALRGNHDAATLDDCRAACPQCSGAVDAPRASQ